MKKFLLTLITLFLLMGLSSPTYAAESGDDPIMEQPIQQEQDKEPVVVATLEELQAAIDAAEDGDTIILSKKINLNNVSLICTKDVTIREGTDNHCFFSISGDCELSGLKILSDYSKSTFALIESIGSKICNVKINDCQFIRNGNNDVLNGTFLINIFSGNIEFKNCKFLNEEGTTLSINSAAIVNIESCSFTGTHTLYVGGAIRNYGDLTIGNTEIVDNSAGKGGAIYNAGSLTISNSIIKRNIGKDEFDVVEGNDIYSSGVLTIKDEQSTDAGFYEETTGEKLTLPLVDYTGTARLTYLADEQATEYFAPKPPKEEPAPEPGDDGDGEDTTPDGEETDNPDKEDQDIPQKPTQPPQDGNEDNTTDTAPQPPEQSQKPVDGDNGNNDNYAPPTDYRPSQRPLWPIVTVKPTEDNKPQTQPDNNSASGKPQLVCNGAVIDTSRTVVLLGYGDGQAHENDPLTRAQMATVIYRLLNDDSIALYSNAQVAFADIAPYAWYSPYINVIQAAGIVNGVGGGLYDPEGLLTWGQTLAVLSRFVEQKEYTLQYINYHGWAEQPIQTAVANGWIMDSTAFNPDAIISRGQLEQLINSVLALYR